MPLSEQSRQRLLGMAIDSIRHGLAHASPLDVVVSELPEELRAPRATFVTLERKKRLRGCIGMLCAFGSRVTRRSITSRFRVRVTVCDRRLTDSKMCA